MSGVVSDSSSSKSPDDLSDAERREILAAENAHGPRSAAFQTGRIPVPPKALKWAAALVVVLGLGGILGDHFFPGVGKPTTPTLSVKSRPGITAPTTPASPNSIESLQSFMRLKFIDSAAASDFTLTAQTGKKWSLSAQKDHVVVLTFFDSACNDICPILGAEIRLASQQLGHFSTRVEFVVVNTDPRQTRVSDDVSALRAAGLTHVPSAIFLTGRISQLDNVWTKYGILITVGAEPNEVSHNNAIYFIGPHGNIAAYGVPPAQEDSFGQYSLSESVLRRYAEGIAVTAKGLLQ